MSKLSLCMEINRNKFLVLHFVLSFFITFWNERVLAEFLSEAAEKSDDLTIFFKSQNNNIHFLSYVATEKGII